ncbi:MAG: hypothetical protein RL127_704 [Bacteroidota bacterium]
MRNPGKVIGLLLLSFIFVVPLRGQLLMPVRKATGNFFRLGIKGGVSLTNLTLDGLSVNGASDYIAKSMTAKNGYVAGIYARLGRRVFVQPELLAGVKYAKVNVLNAALGLDKKVEIGYTSIDIPLMLGYRLGPLHVMAGPVASYSMTPNSTFNQFLSANNSISNAITNAYFSYTAGAGIDLLGFTLDVRYESNLTDLSKTVPLPSGVNFSQKASSFQATLGMKIL